MANARGNTQRYQLAGNDVGTVCTENEGDVKVYCGDTQGKAPGND
jgi:hypothetical protein